MLPTRFNAAKPTAALSIAIVLTMLVAMPTRRASSAISFRSLQPSSVQQKDDDVVRVNTDLVVLNATVLGKDGKFVSGLRRGEFQILEDGKVQTLTSFSAEETPFAAAIVIDTSGSMDTRLTLARSAAIQFLDGLRESDVAAVYNFDYKVEQLQDFSPGRDLPQKAFGLRAKTTTALNDAVLRAADDLAARPNPEDLHREIWRTVHLDSGWAENARCVHDDPRGAESPIHARLRPHEPRARWKMARGRSETHAPRNYRAHAERLSRAEGLACRMSELTPPAITFGSEPGAVPTLSLPPKSVRERS